MMTLDQLIKQAQELRDEGLPGDSPVLCLTPIGTLAVAAIGDSIGIADNDGPPVPVALLLTLR